MFSTVTVLFQLLHHTRRLFPVIVRIFADGGYAGGMMALTVWRRAAFITGQSPMCTWSSESWAAGSEGRTVGEGPGARRSAQVAWLHDRTIRQEPSRGP